jgi:uncharacterized protein YndB with AHSA1/START domain
MMETTVDLERTLSATVDEVWLALTDTAQLAGWLGRGRLEPREGGAVDLITAGPEGGRVVGVVRAYDPPRVLELTWRFEAEPETLLRIELEPAGRETVLRLSHRELPAELREDYRRGWQLYLDALGSGLGGSVSTGHG